MTTKSNKAFNNLPILPPKQSLVETIAILKQESKSAVALAAEIKGKEVIYVNTKLYKLLKRGS